MHSAERKRLLHNQATIQESMGRFDRMIQSFVLLLLPDLQKSSGEISLVATGLNGYVTQVAIRWVMGGFKQSQEDIIAACEVVFEALIAKFMH